MIICPKCKEEIEDDSHYCDQCGQALLYCNRCGRVGMGRRCTNCGGLMVTLDEYQRGMVSKTAFSTSSVSYVPQVSMGVSSRLQGGFDKPMPIGGQGVPTLSLCNSSLGIRIEGINGAIIGRRQGPYAQFFQNNMYVSGVHAQLKYKGDTGWSITDKHSSNGTKLNEHSLQPEVEMSIKNGDIVTIANVSLQVSIG